MTPPRVCVTADDFGLRPAHDAAMVELARAARLDAVSVMMHADASLGTAAELARTDVAIGIHLVLVGERPVDASGAVDLLDPSGFLPASWRGLARRTLTAHAAARRNALAAVRAEVRAQIARYRSLGLRLDFVNSHQHVHLVPGVARIVSDELDRAGVAPAMRIPRFASARSVKELLLGASAEVAVRARDARREALRPYGLDASGTESVDHVGRSADAILRDAARLHGDLAELVFHPGVAEGGLEARHLAWGYAWEAEAELLRSGAVDDALRARGLTRGRPGDHRDGGRGSIPTASETK